MTEAFLTLKSSARDITGQRFGKLVAIGPVRRDKYRHPLWLCQCDCGGTLIDTAQNVSRNKGCGCHRRERTRELNRKHNHDPKGRPSPTYYSWVSMKTRCLNPNHDGYAAYGGRGITIHEPWVSSFVAFLNDMGERPAGLTLDRIDVNGNYEPGNCRWATAKEQRANQRR